MSGPIEQPRHRAFLDANVLFAAALGGGCAKLWASPAVQLVTSEYAAHEAWVNLRFAPATEPCRLRLLELLEPPLEFVPWSPQRQHALSAVWTLPDPSDIPILTAAIQSSCTYLLTGDTACFGQYLGRTTEGLTILRPGKFLALLGL
jgi:predicted nucleic acid-binding protein